MPENPTSSPAPAPRIRKAEILKKRFTLVLICLEFAVVLYISLIDPSFFEALKSRTELLVGAVVWLLTLLGVIAAGVLKKGFESFDEMLGNWVAQTIVGVLAVILLALLTVLLCCPELILPRSASLVVTTTLYDQGARGETVEGRAVLKSGPTVVPHVIYRGKPAGFLLNLNTPYTLEFQPFDSCGFASDPMSGILRTRYDTVSIPVRPRSYLAVFNLVPPNARLTIPDSGITLRNNEMRRLKSGTFRYKLVADGFKGDSAAFVIPPIPNQCKSEETHVIAKLTDQKEISVRFLIDIGIGGKQRLINGMISARPTGYSSGFSAPSGSPVKLKVGREYTISARATRQPGIRKDIYKGSIQVTPTETMNTSITIKATRQP